MATNRYLSDRDRGINAFHTNRKTAVKQINAKGVNSRPCSMAAMRYLFKMESLQRFYKDLDFNING